MSGRSPTSILIRLNEKIKKTFKCWLWKASINPDGYGKFGMNKKTYLAHRAVYEVLIGVIPEGKTLDHLCRNRKCVNPQHLEPVSLWENQKRGNSLPAINARKLFCKWNHPLIGKNVRLRNRVRYCIACLRISYKKRWQQELERRRMCV